MANSCRNRRNARALLPRLEPARARLPANHGLPKTSEPDPGTAGYIPSSAQTCHAESRRDRRCRASHQGRSSKPWSKSAARYFCTFRQRTRKTHRAKALQFRLVAHVGIRLRRSGIQLRDSRISEVARSSERRRQHSKAMRPGGSARTVERVLCSISFQEPGRRRRRAGHETSAHRRRHCAPRAGVLPPRWCRKDFSNSRIAREMPSDSYCRQPRARAPQRRNRETAYSVVDISVERIAVIGTRAKSVRQNVIQRGTDVQPRCCISRSRRFRFTSCCLDSSDRKLARRVSAPTRRRLSGSAGHRPSCPNRRDEGPPEARHSSTAPMSERTKSLVS